MGNHGEMFGRTLGKGSDIGLPRGLNNLRTGSGLMYAEPLRQDRRLRSTDASAGGSGR